MHRRGADGVRVADPPVDHVTRREHASSTTTGLNRFDSVRAWPECDNLETDARLVDYVGRPGDGSCDLVRRTADARVTLRALSVCSRTSVASWIVEQVDGVRVATWNIQVFEFFLISKLQVSDKGLFRVGY